MIPAMVAVMAQTEKTRGFDDLYYYIENLDVFEYGQ
jgi:beta-galactosidase